VSDLTAAAGTFPGAVAPARRRDVVSDGVRLAVHEWGAADAPPLLLAHGGFDFARTFDVFAPLLAEAGWRVVSWDQRGHGDSAYAHLYSWRADLRDARAVMDSIGPDPMPIVGHSKGGSILLEMADAMPWRVARLANLDGLPSEGNQPDVPDHDRTRMLASELTGWLDHHRKKAGAVRRPGTVEELAQRRGRMNPRLTPAWLQYLVTVGARESDDGWRWKIDPALRLGGFGPWKPEWSMNRMPGLSMPMLGILGLEVELMGWGTQAADVLPYLPPDARFEALEGTGHFVHVEQPRLVADLVLDFLGDPA
jgi:pimeloyl-ACP methyl ester carboxylesterase